MVAEPPGIGIGPTLLTMYSPPSTLNVAPRLFARFPLMAVRPAVTVSQLPLLVTPEEFGVIVKVSAVTVPLLVNARLLIVPEPESVEPVSLMNFSDPL